jgi:hypothetical protein
MNEIIEDYNGMSTEDRKKLAGILTDNCQHFVGEAVTVETLQNIYQTVRGTLLAYLEKEYSMKDVIEFCGYTLEIK